MPQTPTIRLLTLAEVETLVDWAAGEGWNPGLADAAAFHAADPDGFLGAFADGEMVAGISAVAYGETFGFIGLYICRPDRRGRGHGKAVWDAGMARLAGRTIGLDGVPAQQANYRSMGFVAAYRTIRYSGRFAPADTPSGAVRPVTPDLVEAVAAFDGAFFPAPRRAFLEQWLRPPHAALVAMGQDGLAGYGVARPCREGFKIGPLFARNGGTAGLLLSALAGVCGGPIHIDVPETAGSFPAFLAAAGLSPGFETARMYRGAAPAVDLGGVFGITTLELG
ncbi:MULTISPECIES: GNAT family N-acetyltransferase [unclassified Chelatococcus]|uniref:GNAT family N-acetyltransferase n=1 Tax=unclassified Chelatococcus TaxID=2638111 RepID=UPI0003198C67|nr:MULTISPECIES: GNAT family N-acetyltransferase [unclassified Chelatococcus]ALA20362.1 GCN5 family acetyltransferase [Chelatococcus sp. CO-6]